MNPASLTRTADALLEARRTATPIPPPHDVISLADGYAVQLETARRAGGFEAWKVALFRLGGEHFYSPILPATVVPSGTRFAAGTFCLIALEGEIAFRLARPVRAADLPLSRGEVEALISEAMPAIEVVDSRLTQGMASPEPARLADLMSSGALVLGAPIADWRGRDLGRPGFEIRNNGDLIASADSNRLGDLIGVLAGLLAHCRAMGVDLEAGALVSTGSSTGLIHIEQGADITLERDGEVLVRAAF